MLSEQIIILARKNVDSGKMTCSARICLEDAVKSWDNGDYESARKWAIRSLRYSVGILHPDYQNAAKQPATV